MPAAKLTPEQWGEIRAANEAGVDTEILAERFNVRSNAIRQRRFREKWVTPRLIEEQRMVEQAKARARAMGQSTVTRVSNAPSALEITAETLTAKAQEGSLHAAAMFLAAIMETQEQGGIAPARNGKELATLMKGLRLPAGLDRSEGTTINIGALWGTGSQQRTERDVSPAKALIVSPAH